MKIELNIDEAKILELAQTHSMNELPQAIFYEARKQGIEVAVAEIKAKLVEKSYYGGKETLYGEVQDYLYKQIESVIKEKVETKFSEKNIELIVERNFNQFFTQWVEKKIYERLEQVKKDIFIGSSGELKAEEEAREQAHQDELNAMKES